VPVLGCLPSWWGVVVGVGAGEGPLPWPVCWGWCARGWNVDVASSAGLCWWWVWCCPVVGWCGVCRWWVVVGGVWHAVGVLREHLPLVVGVVSGSCRVCRYTARVGCLLLGCRCGGWWWGASAGVGAGCGPWVGWLLENCIVDASIF